jgi:GTP-binding protein
MADRRHVPETVGRKAPGPGDQSEEAEALEFGRWLFAQDCRFVTGAADLSVLPPAELPEVAFAGRSNVGKSSLVNALTGRTTLARISRTPGRTRQLNFFSLGGRLMLADLPGYGFARAPKRDIKAWTRLVEDYLRGRPNLRRLCLLVDARLGPKESDRDLMARLDSAGVLYQVILTKTDKVTRDELEGRLAALQRELARHPAAHTEVAVTSARTGLGVASLRAALAALAADAGRR